MSARKPVRMENLGLVLQRMGDVMRAENTTTHPTRQEADAWWESNDRDRTGIAYRHATIEELPEHGWIHEWWRSLPDERAVTIYQQENRG